MKKIWPLLFILVPIGGLGLFIYAAANPELNWWFPEDVSTHGHEIDFLFNVILWITGIAFLLTTIFQAVFMMKYGERGEKGTYVHGNHKAEVLWTVIPAAILIFIAFYQFEAWQNVKFTQNFPKDAYKVEVLAGQFEWRMRYAGNDDKFGTRDDIIVVNDMHVPVNKPILVQLDSRDVLHSFFLPNLRLKQDAVPGQTIPLWFEATKEGEYDIVCAELCGWGHYKMKGRLKVESNEDFEKWLKAKYEEQEATK